MIYDHLNKDIIKQATNICCTKKIQLQDKTIFGRDMKLIYFELKDKNNKTLPFNVAIDSVYLNAIKKDDTNSEYQQKLQLTILENIVRKLNHEKTNHPKYYTDEINILEENYNYFDKKLKEVKQNEQTNI